MRNLFTSLLIFCISFSVQAQATLLDTLMAEIHYEAASSLLQGEQNCYSLWATAITHFEDNDAEAWLEHEFIPLLDTITGNEGNTWRNDALVVTQRFSSLLATYKRKRALADNSWERPLKKKEKKI